MFPLLETYMLIVVLTQLLGVYLVFFHWNLREHTNLENNCILYLFAKVRRLKPWKLLMLLNCLLNFQMLAGILKYLKF